jgi:hypothetical protein
MTLEDFRPQIRGQVRRSVAAKLPWRRPVRDDLGAGKLLCFDQSLSRTGFVALECGVGLAELRVHQALTLRGHAPEGAVGRDKDLGEFLDLHRQFVELLLPYAGTDWQVLHEATPLGRGLINPESSLLAAAAVQVSAVNLGLAVLKPIDPKHHRTLIAGRMSFREPGEGQVSPAEGKRRFHVELVKTAESVGLSLALVTNESRRDALAVGLAELIDRRRLP